MKFINCLFIFFILCLWAASAYAVTAEKSPLQDNNIHINADRMDQSMPDEVYTAEGNVVVLWNGTHLTANKVRYAAANHMMYAYGSVVLSKDNTILKGNTLVMDMDTGRAEIDPAQLTMTESNMTLVADKLVRINENQFTATSNELTACDIPNPSWKFSTTTLNVDTQDYATGRNVIFYIKDIPVLYLPWFAYPIVTDKKSGLLFPHFSYSKSKGMQVIIPAYLVISPSQDLQLDLDIQSERGIGTGINYRYIRKRGSEGNFSGYQIYDKISNGWRWQLAENHTEIFSSDANLRMSANASGDKTFLSDYSENNGEYNKQAITTTVNTLKTWQHYAANAYLQYNDNLYDTNNRKTLQTFPSLGVAGVRHSFLDAPLYFDIDVAADNLYRKEAPSGQRLHLFPRVTLIPSKSPYLQIAFFGGAHLRGYSTDKRDVSNQNQSKELDVLPEIGVRLSTSLANIYSTDLQSLKKIKHEIIPELDYGFLPGRSQQHLPFYDYTDRMIHRNMISLSVTNLINGKFASGQTSEYRDISRIKLSADYEISGERRDLLTLVESQYRWSDLSLETDTWLNKQLRLTFDSRYNVYEKLISTAVAGVELNDHKGNTIGGGYQMARNEVQYMEGRLSTQLMKPVNFSYTARYSFDRKEFLETVYTTEYRHKCWRVTFAFHQRPGNESYSVNFNLAGL